MCRTTSGAGETAGKAVHVRVTGDGYGRCVPASAETFRVY